MCCTTVLTLAVVNGLNGAGWDRPAGVVVTSVAPRSAGERAGLEPGDVIAAWMPPASGTAGEEDLRRPVLSEVDLREAELELAARPGGKLVVCRHGSELTFALSAGTPGLTVRPALSPAVRAAHDNARQLLAADLVDQARAAQTRASHDAAHRGDTEAERWLWAASAEVSSEAGQLERATGARRRALAAARDGGDVLAAVHAWAALGETLESHGEPLEAGQAIGAALGLRRGTTSESLGMASVLLSLAGADLTRGDLDRARRVLQRAEVICRRLAPDSLPMADLLYTLGRVAAKRGEVASAESLQLAALIVRERLAPGEVPHADSLLQVGFLAWSRGRLDEAEETYREARAIYEAVTPGSVRVAAVLLNLGLVAWHRGELDRAEELFLGALSIYAERAEGTINHAHTLLNLGNLASDRGWPSAAEDYYQQALEIYQRLAPGSLYVAHALNNLGIVARHRGDLDHAEASFQRALATYREQSPNSLAAAACLVNLGSVAQSQGDFERAEARYLSALGLYELLAPESPDVAQTLSWLGLLSEREGDLASAQAYLERALNLIQRQAPESLETALTLDFLGYVDQQRGSLDEAEKHYRRALKIRERHSPGGLNVGLSYFNLGGVARDRGRLEEAETSYRNALGIEERLAPGSATQAEILYELARLLERQARPAEALAHARRAVAALDSQGGRVGGSSDTLELFLHRYAHVYRHLVGLLTRLDRPGGAFQALERFRARVLLQMLAERDLLFSGDAPGELLEELRATILTSNRVRTDLAEMDTSSSADEVAALQQRMVELDRGHRQLIERLRDSAPRLASLRYPEPLGATEAARLLDPRTLLLSFCVGEDRVDVFSILDGELGVHTAAIERSTLEADVGSLRRLLVAPTDAAPDLSRDAHRLYQALLAPVADRLALAQRVLVCPDGPLHRLPFAVLQPSPGHYLIEDRPVSRIISVTVLAEIESREPRRIGELQIAAFGDPVYGKLTGAEIADPVLRSVLRISALHPLPSTRDEVESICGHYRGRARAFLGTAAREEVAKALDPGIPYIHFACHGVLNERFPLDSALVLTVPEPEEEAGENGILQAWEVLESIRVDADLVTLSACDTGLGRELSGEGLVGLTRAFHYAGARTVLSSLWRVADRSTAEFMKRLYRNLAAGMPKAAALRQVQVDFLREPVTVEDGEGDDPRPVAMDVSHPFYWAGFVLDGSWR